MFQQVSQFISEIDVLKSGAYISLLYGYCCPTIQKTKQSFINAIQIRHPIIERIRKPSPSPSSSLRLHRAEFGDNVKKI